MSEGTVKWFNPRKGYGFIAAQDGREVFVHYASIKAEGFKNLAEGDNVTFDITEGEKGLRAENVELKANSEKPIESEPDSENPVESESDSEKQDEPEPDKD